MCDIVWVSPEEHWSESESFHFFLQAPQWPCPVRKRFRSNHCCRGRAKPGCRIVGSSTGCALTTEADFQDSLHWLLMSTGSDSRHKGFRDVRRNGGGLEMNQVYSTVHGADTRHKIKFKCYHEMHITSWQVTYRGVVVSSIEDHLLKASSSIESPLTSGTFDWWRLHFTQLTLKCLHTTTSPVIFSSLFNWPPAKWRGIQFQSVCQSVRQNFRKPRHRKFISAVHIRHISRK